MAENRGCRRKDEIRMIILNERQVKKIAHALSDPTVDRCVEALQIIADAPIVRPGQMLGVDDCREEL